MSAIRMRTVVTAAAVASIALAVPVLAATVTDVTDADYPALAELVEGFLADNAQPSPGPPVVQMTDATAFSPFDLSPPGIDGSTATIASLLIQRVEGLTPDAAPDLFDVAGWECGSATDDLVVVCPADGAASPPSGPALLFGVRPASPIPPHHCSLHLVEHGVALQDPSGPVFEPGFDGDLFGGANSAMVLRCTEGQWQAPGLLTLDHGAFVVEPGHAYGLVTPNGVVGLLWPGEAGAARIFSFITDAAAPYEPDRVAASTWPDLTAGPELLALGEVATFEPASSGAAPAAPSEGATAAPGSAVHTEDAGTDATDTADDRTAAGEPTESATTVAAAPAASSGTASPFWWVLFTGLFVTAAGVVIRTRALRIPVAVDVGLDDDVELTRRPEYAVSPRLVVMPRYWSFLNWHPGWANRVEDQEGERGTAADDEPGEPTLEELLDRLDDPDPALDDLDPADLPTRSDRDVRDVLDRRPVAPDEPPPEPEREPTLEELLERFDDPDPAAEGLDTPDQGPQATPLSSVDREVRGYFSEVEAFLDGRSGWHLTDWAARDLSLDAYRRLIELALEARVIPESERTALHQHLLDTPALLKHILELRADLRGRAGQALGDILEGAADPGDAERDGSDDDDDDGAVDDITPIVPLS